ncbi:MAG TPA: EF-hand domain-containing protein [Geminicoccaceae bacterium]|nr:EF-hand domain-containing protein [Geminicoccaceae bacterium]
MRSIDRRAPGRRTQAILSRLCAIALALWAFGTSPDQAAAAAVDLGDSFDILDDNGDGVIRREEFLRKKTEIFYRALTNLDLDQRLNPGDLNLTQDAFAEADLDGDGKLSGSEFVQARFMQFDAMDADGDQEITEEEFRTFMSRYHQ